MPAESTRRIAARYLVAKGYFNVGDIVLMGKYKNKRAKIVAFGVDKWGNPTIEVEPIPKGRKQNKVIGLYKIWRADVKEKALAEQAAAAADGKMASEDDDAEDDDWEDRLGDLDDPIKLADSILTEVSKDPDGELGPIIKKVEAILTDLRDAETVETESDLDACIESAHKSAVALEAELKRAKADAKRDKLPETVEVLDEALSEYRQFMRELREILPEK